MENMLSASDVALLNRENDGFGFNGGGAIWIIALLFLFMAMGNRNDPATASDVRDGFDFAALERQNNEIVAEVENAVTVITSAIKDGNYNMLGEIRDLQQVTNNGFTRMMEQSCETLRSIDNVNYKGEINKGEILTAIHAEGEATRNMYQRDRMEQMQQRINSLELQQAMCGVVRYPNTMSFDAGPSPFCNCGYNAARCCQNI